MTRLKHCCLLAALAALLTLATPPVQASDGASTLRRATLIVADAEASLRFYRDVIGMSVYLDTTGTVTVDSLPSHAPVGSPSRFIIMQGKHPWLGMIGLLQYGSPVAGREPDAPLAPGDTVLMIETGELEAIHQRMLAAGTPIHRPPRSAEVGAGGNRWLATFLFARDPDGHMLELNQRGAVTAQAMTTPSLRREFHDTRLGQVHLRRAAPAPLASGLRTPVVLLHQTPLSGRMFATLLPELATDRVVYAPDTPGYGESATPAAQPSFEEYAAALGEVLIAIGEPVDLVGYHTGAGLAVQLARLYPERVRRVVLIAMPLLEPAQRERFLGLSGAALPEDGSHLMEMWQSSMRARPPGQTLEQVASIVTEKQRAGRHGEWAIKALAAVDLADQLAALTVPGALVRPKDGLWDATGRAAAIRPDWPLVDREDWIYGMFDADPAGVAALLRELLDR
jgi:pimeloyl-ACP methyl ester carboxylesterase/catechol 2,3-dioxygenase-like lactoylglutathione lyase family enzyme